jgi:predicted signal transduction protein with EAL and GGDEF domain
MPDRLDQRLRVTVSIGVAHGAGPFTDTERLIGAADVLLYAAKNSGRNAVAFRDGTTARVHLAGPAGQRRVISQARHAETHL